MREELYFIKDNERIQLDLNSPSGITLNFKSNIFGDLSKITCSYSYTFKLPLTRNNRIAFDLADDVRHSSSMVRKRLKAEFWINGIQIFDDANLYLDTVEGSYQAVMTWGVVRGLETLTNNDISIRELPFNGMPEIIKFFSNTPVARPDEWKNTLDYFIPFRKSEGSYIYNDRKYIYDSEYGSQSLPVVPVQRIIQAINEYYGTSFFFGDEFDGSKEWNDSTKKYNETSLSDLIAFGAVPLVKRGITEKQLKERTGILYDVEVLNNSFWGIALKVWDDLTAFNVISYDYKAPGVNNYFDIGNNGSTGTNRKYTFFRKGLAVVTKVCLDGYIKVTMSNIGRRWKNNALDFDRSDVIPKLIIYKRKFQLNEGSSTVGTVVYDEAVTLDGVRCVADDKYVTNGEYMYHYYAFEFDFRASEGKNNLELDDFLSSNEAYPYFMSINDTVESVKEVSDFYIIPKGEISDNISTGYEIDIRSNLPDISCLTFMKALYYMIGAFPNVDSAGKIIAHFYKSLDDNINSGIIKNWSSKLITGIEDLPDKTSFALSGYSQKNYYLMKNDELDSEGEDNADVYESGMGTIVCENETLDKMQTIIQLPFYGAFLKDASRPSLVTGNDMKYVKYNEDGTTEPCEAKPAIGTVAPIQQCTYDYPSSSTRVPVPSDTYSMILSIWDGFKNINAIPSYNYLQSIVKEPLVITDKFLLNELDLRDLDFSVPIYLEKYNSYFAIVSITRDSKGVCKCELIKLP